MELPSLMHFNTLDLLLSAFMTFKCVYSESIYDSFSNSFGGAKMLTIVTVVSGVAWRGGIWDACELFYQHIECFWNAPWIYLVECWLWTPSVYMFWQHQFTVIFCFSVGVRFLDPRCARQARRHIPVPLASRRTAPLNFISFVLSISCSCCC